jgi:hypothetical protein
MVDHNTLIDLAQQFADHESIHNSGSSTYEMWTKELPCILKNVLTEPAFDQQKIELLDEAFNCACAAVSEYDFTCEHYVETKLEQKQFKTHVERREEGLAILLEYGLKLAKSPNANAYRNLSYGLRLKAIRPDNVQRLESLEEHTFVGRMPRRDPELDKLAEEFETEAISR